MYDRIYKDFNFNGITYGDYISGESLGGIKFSCAQLVTVGGGTLGVWVDDVPIEFNPANGGDVLIKESLQLVSKVNDEQKKRAGRSPWNEVIINLPRNI